MGEQARVREADYWREASLDDLIEAFCNPPKAGRRMRRRLAWRRARQLITRRLS